MTQKKHILFMTYDGLCDPLGQSQVLPYVEGLIDLGYRFSLITFEKESRYQSEGKKLHNRCSSQGIDWHPLSYTKHPPVLSTVYDMRRLHQTALTIHLTNAVDMVHARSYLPCITALKFKVKFGIPYLFDMRGFYADERVDGNIWDLRNPLYKKVYTYFKVQEYHFLEEAAAVVSLTHAGKKEIENHYVENPLFGGGESFYNYDRAVKTLSKTVVIPCTCDLDHFDFRSVSKNKRLWLGAVHGIDPALTYLGYVGSLGTWYMLDEMLAFYEILRKREPDVHFLVITNDPTDILYEKAAARGIPSNCIIHAAASRKEVPVFMSMMAASIFFIVPTYSKKASSPTKQGELMAMGVPLICNAGVGDADSLIAQTGTGLVLRSFDNYAMEKIVNKWEELIALDKAEIRSVAEESFSLSWAVEEFSRLYKKVLDQ